MSPTIRDVKRAAQVLRDELSSVPVEISHGRALEIVAHQLGHADWNTAVAKLPGPAAEQDAEIGAPIPILRIQEQRSAYEFYVDYLGFAVEWEHRFEPGLPLYARLSRSELTVDLSEHYGDATPGSTLWVPVRDVTGLHAELSAKRNPHSRPGIERDAPGGPTLTVIDPFSNRIRFCEPT
jgi:hypothetical protein